MVDISERNFEDTIVEGLTGARPGGYDLRDYADYDRGLCLDTEKVYQFIRATQPKQWERLREFHGEDTRDAFMRRLSGEIGKRGLVDVLRHGIKDRGCTFEMCYFKPASRLNEDLQRLYELNQFSVIRQLRYSTGGEQSLDIVLFLNGMPLFTAELKNRLNAQDVEDAVRQYKHNRDPREELFRQGRCAAHFAVDNERARMATHLQDKDTRFLPFNRGWNGGAGNPPAKTSFPTAYLWEEIWAPSSVLNLVQYFIHDFEEIVEGDNGRKRKERRVIFPRFQQLDCVRKLIDHCREHGPGETYLIQHSAGSGKSNSIAWLAHQLSVLHDENDERVFDTICVVTDRIVLDEQLQQTVKQFEQTLGLVETIDGTSQQLKDALEKGKNIIVTTLWKFPVIVDEVASLPGERFAVIVDEAHSSQAGEASRDMRETLAADSLEEAEEQEPTETRTVEDEIREQMERRGRQPNMSLFAFTATPKAKTLEMFGTRQKDGSFAPFHLYTMRQAIEEGFILDVLENYTTYKTYWNLRKAVEDDPRYERPKANYLLREWVDLHPHNISEKVGIIVGHFTETVADRIDGQARAMIVTRSRLHTVRYFLQLRKTLREQKLPWRALVAFSGEVKDPDTGEKYTEAGLNGVPQAQTKAKFEEDDYRFLVVAEKFQTGFDQPLLHTMYVDRKLGGVHAVQTLSRLNRVHPDKDECMVLDFANEADDIQAAFEPYYDKLLLSEESDPNLLYELERRLMEFEIFDRNEIERLAKIYFSEDGTQEEVHSALQPPVDRYNDREEDEQSDFRSMLTKYVRQYAFLSQIVDFHDTDLEKLYTMARLLLRELPINRDELPRQVTREIDMDSYRVQRTHEGGIPLDRGEQEVEPLQEAETRHTEELPKDPLSEIIVDLNDRFGADLTEDDRVFLEQLESKLEEDETLANAVQVNTPENARLTFDQVVDDTLQDMVDANFELYRKITDNRQFGAALLGWLFESYLRKVRDA